MERFPITPSGYDKMNEELKNLKLVERPAVIKAISEARELGDLSENAEYHAAREKQSFIEGRIMELEDKIARAEVINYKEISGNSVKFGATVKVVNEDTDEEKVYQIVGEYEADITKNLISVNSPLARALIGKSAGDSVRFSTPGGAHDYEILEVNFK